MRITGRLLPPIVFGNRACLTHIRKKGHMPDSNPTENLPPKHDPFDAPDAEDEAVTRERVGEDAGDGHAEEVRRQLGLERDGDFS
jgi:hypothetical protein